MATARLPRIERGLVHKTYPENVHITEIYRELPALLDPASFAALCARGDEAAGLFELYWLRLDSGGGRYLGFPVRLGADHFRTLLRRPGTPAELLDRAYRWESGERRLDPDLAERAEIRSELLRAFQGRDMAADEVEEKLMSDRLEAMGGEKANVFRGRLLVEPTHAYWFEHPNEHIPGMLLIEGGRQMGLAVGHRFGGIPRTGVQNVIGEIKVNFYNYADISHEIGLRTVVESVRTGREGFWIWGLLHVHFFQHEKELGRISIDSAAVKSKVLARIRHAVSRPGYRYVPHAGVRVSIYLEHAGRRSQGAVGNLNFNGFQAIFENEEFAREIEYDFFLFFDALGYIAGRARFLWKGRGPDRQRSGFQITRFKGEQDRRLLDELLKRYFYVNRYG